MTVPADALADLYLRAGLSAAEAGKRLGVSGRVVLRAAHDQGLPVRIGGPAPRRGPAPELAQELYVACGLSLRHIELLTGQPAETVRDLLHAHGIQLRPAGGRSPFMRRWRSAG